MCFGRYHLRIVAFILVAALATSLSFIAAVTGKQLPVSSISQIDPFALMSTAAQLPAQSWDAI
jgi:hypothetical protein